MIDRFERLLGCPRCRSALVVLGTRIECPDCGLVGVVRNGIYDFLYDAASVVLAGNAPFDLRRDEARARGEETEADGGASPSGRARRRFERRYRRIETEVGSGHGAAILHKIDARLAERGLPAAGGAWALEAGGATGRFVPGFARAFEGVVLLDCSLANLVVAHDLLAREELADVFYVRGDVMALPLADAAFDLVHENGVIEHVADPDRMVAEALRVTAPDGIYVCVSPNRYSLAPEPHFRVPAFGFIPRKVRARLIAWVRDLESEEGTELRSLPELRRFFARAGHPAVDVFFLPRGLEETARATPVRRLVRSLLGVPVIGGLLSLLLNRVLLAVMPQHIAVAQRAK